MPFTVVLLMILLIPVYCSLMTIVLWYFIVVTDVIFMECLYIMFYVVELSASEHLFEISAI